MNDSAADLIPVDLEMNEVFSDSSFNCRGVISPFDVRDLAQDIEARGLQTPITVQPFNSPPFKWRIVAGHRRHMAFESLERKSIPAFIKEGLSEEDSIVYNLNENLKRKELNAVQEADVCSKLQNLGHSISEIAHLTKTSIPWVNVRLMILELAPEIQREVSAGLITLDQVKRLARASSLENQQELVRAMKDQKLLGRKRVNETKKQENLKKARSRGEINIFQQVVMNVLGEDFSVRCLAWAQGEISDKEIHESLHEEAKIFDKNYSIPAAYRDDILTEPILTADQLVTHKEESERSIGEMNYLSGGIPVLPETPVFDGI